MLSPRGFYFCRRRGAKSAFVRAAVLAGEAKWTAKGIKDPGPTVFRAFRPIFLGRRKSEARQIGRSEKEAAAHPQAKSGALKEPGGSVPPGGQPLATLFREP